MFRKSNEMVSRKAIVAAFVAGLLAVSASASQPPSTGLGQAWPNAQDVSASPHYHVYVFVRDGIRYVQVNDLNGTVRGAVAVANHVVLVLPVGIDAGHVTTSSSASPKAASAQTVYDDGATQIVASPASDGSLNLQVAETSPCTNFDCTGQVVTNSDSPCTNFDCTGQVVTNSDSPCTNFDCTGQVVTNSNSPCTNFDCTGQVISKNGR
ncbi:hypothetical protein [Dyella mobilis]|uniref:IgGFc-binding protein N-terminal domain-containing protein n=1 Tax=Dyella mobilis TaxID=1849582 RepID=A0ABS2KK30_9GAMM|nr:hypothetical protein [Dyella mobilis]MBM7131429.1 hypothetical protein [Dyella mobilis]GLQ96598.1 hypothetical protein GCM10007863_10160 [Dyella mobilis]